MSFKDYAKSQGYKLFETPVDVMEELREIVMHYEALEDKNREEHKNWNEKNIQAITWTEILHYRSNWFSLSILGINLPKYFIKEALQPAFKDSSFENLSPHIQLAVVALVLLLWIELHESEILLARHQKELLIILIDTLIAKGKIDAQLFAGPIKIAGFENPDFTKKYITAVSAKLAGLNVQFKNPS